MSRAPPLPVVRALCAGVVCENSWSGIQSSGFYLQTPHSETLGTDFRKPLLNIAPQESLKLWCEQRRFGVQTPGSSSLHEQQARYSVVPVCLFGSVVGNLLHELGDLSASTAKGHCRANVIRVNTDPARKVSLWWNCCSAPLYRECSQAPGVLYFSSSLAVEVFANQLYLEISNSSCTESGGQKSFQSSLSHHNMFKKVCLWSWPDSLKCRRATNEQGPGNVGKEKVTQTWGWFFFLWLLLFFFFFSGRIWFKFWPLLWTDSPIKKKKAKPQT